MWLRIVDEWPARVNDSSLKRLFAAPRLRKAGMVVELNPWTEAGADLASSSSGGLAVLGNLPRDETRAINDQIHSGIVMLSWMNNIGVMDEQYRGWRT
jgi:hypothetical protein